MRKVIWATLAAGLFSLATMAQATLVTWNLTNVTFDEGASGFFAVDPTVQINSSSTSFDIKTTPRNASLVSLEYNAGATSSGETFSTTLVRPSAGGTILLADGAAEAGFDVGRMITGSSVTGVLTVLEACGFAVLLGLSLAALLLLRRLK